MAPEPDPPSGRASGASWALPAAGIALLVAAAYANATGAAYLLDDGASITENASIRSLSPLSRVLLELPPSTSARPLVNLSFAIDRALWDTDAAAVHAVNVVIHLLAAFALFGVLRRTLVSAALPERIRGAATGLAFAVAAIWAVHPLQTESVTYACQRAESLMGLFFLTTLLCAIRGAASARPRAWSAAAVVVCALGMATKEVMAAAPLLVLLHDRTFLAGSFREALRRRPGMYAGLAATWGLLAWLMVSSDAHGGSVGFGLGVSARDYAATQPGAIVTYLRLAVWPHPLVLDRGAHLASTAGEIVPHAIAVAALVAATAWALVRRPALGLAGAWFLAILAPSSSFVPLVTQTAAEHRMYLPLAAVVGVLVVAGHELTRRIEGGGASRAALAVVLAAFVWRTHERNEQYASPRAMWQEVVDGDPGNVRGWMNLGLAKAHDGELAEAVDCLDRAVALDPGNAYARLLRGNLLHEADRDDEAIADYTAAAKSPRRAARALTSRAIVRLAQGRADLALADLDAALAMSPDSADAFTARAAARLDTGDVAGARADAESARRLGRPPSARLAERLAAGR